MHEPIWIGPPGADPAQPSAAATRPRAAADREPLARQARETDAGRQLRRCFPSWTHALDHLRWAALARLARNEPVDPNDPDSGPAATSTRTRSCAAHGVTGVAPTRLTLQAVGRLIDAQADTDRDAGLDWTRITTPARALDPAPRRAHARLGVDLEDPPCGPGDPTNAPRASASPETGPVFAKRAYCVCSAVAFSFWSDVSQRFLMSRDAIGAASLPSPLKFTLSSTRRTVPVGEASRL
jgi:hypothetical protein